MRKWMIVTLRAFIAMTLIFLTITPAPAQVPMASFLCDHGKGKQVCLVFDDGQVAQLTNHKAKVFTPNFSPDGKFIVYSANIQGGEDFDLRLIDLTNPKKPKDLDLTGKPLGVKLNEPKWAPRGDPRILVYSQELPEAASWDVGMLTLEKGNKPGILINISNGDGKQENLVKDQNGFWSPDGTKIVFESNRKLIDGQTQYDIFIADAEQKTAGKNTKNLSNHAGVDEWGRFSPDGTQVVFQSKRDGDWEIYVVGIDGKNLKQLTNNNKTDRRPNWSRGGIVFESQRDGNWEIYRMDADGNNPVNLTNHPKTDSNPIWSPLGHRILFESRRDGNREVYIIDADGGGLRNLSNNPNGNDTHARWNPVFELLAVEPQQKNLTTLGKVKRTSLLQNYPNPFNPETWMPYYLAEKAVVAVRIYNVKGKLIRSFDIGKQLAGAYMAREKAVYWDGQNNLNQPVSSGTYFYELLADKSSQTRRMVLIK